MTSHTVEEKFSTHNLHHIHHFLFQDTSTAMHSTLFSKTPSQPVDDSFPSTELISKLPPNYYLEHLVILYCLTSVSLISLGILIVVFKRFQNKAFLNKNMASAAPLLHQDNMSV